MDIQQLRSWIFELYDSLENERQYIVFDSTRGNVLVDIPEFGPRPLRLIQGTGSAALLIATNPARAREAERYREALGVRIAAHADDAANIAGGADVLLSDDELVRPDVRTIRVRGKREGATVVLLRKAGGVLVCGDLDLASDAARELSTLVVASETQSRIERAKRPVRAVPAAAVAGDGGAAPAPPKQTKRPRPFAEDWDAPGTERPATTLANAPSDIVPHEVGFKPRPLG